MVMQQGNTQVFEGQLPPGSEDWISLPVEVPDGVDELAVSYSYDRPETAAGVPGNALDIAIFDPAGFRGCSGGAREAFSIGRAAATPGYLAGPIPPGQWQLLVAPYTIAPGGLSYRIQVVFGEGPAEGDTAAPEPAYAPIRAKGRGRAWYRGDMHMHTEHSDGTWSPAQLVAAARAAGLDFIASTEHNTHSAHAVWGRHLNGSDDELLILNGEEVTTRNGHLVAAGLEAGSWLDWRFRAVDGALPSTLQLIHEQGAVAIAAHPHAPCLGCQWKFGYDGIDAVEVWNGAWTPDDEVSLQHWNATLVTQAASGRHWTPAVGDSDTHHPGDPVGLPQTVVLADDLTRDAVLAGIRAGRCYVAESRDISLDVTASAEGRTAGIGERLPVSATTEVTVSLTVSGVSDGVVRLVTDEGWVLQRPVPDSGSLTWTTSPAVSTYVRAEVRRPGPLHFEPMAALTNPIFLGV